ncbi:hypothetical protein DPMN_046553 [Dreissena polymorpha]|uniref:Uncharacterized protein n=1 Tax=Dreissena polymorpha TaxID=45954 RepID=A0A9D4D9T2_DREPO|nr:hypothetical protein DPMN_046553 [Dreissena polymorpha]
MGVTVRKLRNTPEDSEFAAKLLVEAFRGKFVHSITEAKLPIAVRNLSAFHVAQADDFRDRTFVAELDGSPVGVLGLKFHGDEDRDVSDHV